MAMPGEPAISSSSTPSPSALAWLVAVIPNEAELSRAVGHSVDLRRPAPSIGGLTDLRNSAPIVSKLSEAECHGVVAPLEERTYRDAPMRAVDRMRTNNWLQRPAAWSGYGRWLGCRDCRRHVRRSLDGGRSSRCRVDRGRIFRRSRRRHGRRSFRSCAAPQRRWRQELVTQCCRAANPEIRRKRMHRD